MIFIYLFEDDPRYKKKIQSIFYQIENGQIQAITSIISPLEILSTPKLSKENDKTNILANFFQEAPNLKVFPVDWEIMLTASELRRNNLSLKTPDSLQLSTAIIKNAGSFLTNDLKLSKISNLPIKIIPLPEYHTLKYS